jgi:hypothetical protein
MYDIHRLVLRKRLVQTMSNTVVSPRKGTKRQVVGGPRSAALSPPKGASASRLNSVDTDGWLTRYAAMELVGCSMQTLRNHEYRGKLHVQFVMREDRLGTLRETAVYDPKELATLPRYAPGSREKKNEQGPEERAARAYEMFRDGRPLDEVVIELREDPDTVDHLHERWLDQTNARYVITPEAQKSLEELVGKFANVSELVDLVKAKISMAEATSKPDPVDPD